MERMLQYLTSIAVKAEVRSECKKHGKSTWYELITYLIQDVQFSDRKVKLHFAFFLIMSDPGGEKQIQELAQLIRTHRPILAIRMGLVHLVR